ncbi:hypothetical protein A8V01_02175 [Novosphingobium guangzhouense]|uniref:Bacterial surface antigen (D15) domain-containing protein n=1 Tax=Novosphingobium guangzhouense TaxID=1850347 RepID=A0A2K2G6D0_9SPHN|nr:hypothetical protein A8V01_02175 [Novosphingobium guangzhouense]
MPVLAAFCSAASASAAGPGDDVSEIEEQIEAAAKATDIAITPGRDILAVPLPITSPSLGTGLVAAGVAFYNPNGAPSPWISGGAVMKTSNGNWLVGGFHSMSLDDDRIRLNGLVATGKIVADYYGIGAQAGDRNVSTELDQRMTVIRLQAQTRLANRTYLGARLMYLDIDASGDAEPEYPDLVVPDRMADSRLVQLGPVVTYDSRDDSLNPGSGLYAHAEWLFDLKALGGDFGSNRLTAGVSYYRPVAERSVLAFHAGICAASSNAPFYGLCLYGQNNDLRGYKTGRYRDRASWAMQGELRRRLKGRLGAVVFAGVGGIAPSLSRIDDSRFLPAAGAGLRFQPSRDTNINVRLDFAVGRDSSGLYLGIAEAF